MDWNSGPGWEALHARKYDLLITDNNMPRVSGLELVERLRCEAAALPVSLVSGAMLTNELKQHPGLRLAAMLAKPFTGEELLRTVEAVLHNPGQCPRANRAAASLAKPVGSLGLMALTGHAGPGPGGS